MLKRTSASAGNLTPISARDDSFEARVLRSQGRSRQPSRLYLQTRINWPGDALALKALR